MDLLGDYSSDDDDSRSRSPPTPISQKASTAVGLRIPPVMPPPQQQNTKKPAASTTTTSNKPTKTNRRGKKILSLHSVLPPHILEQLTKSEATGMNGDSSDDDDDDDYEERSKKNTGSQAKKPASTHQDKGIASFLSALSSAKTTKATKGSDTGYNKGNIKSSSASEPSSSSLGAAFMSVTSTTTIRKTKDGTAISTAAVAESPTGSDARQTPTGQGEQASSLSPSHYQPLSLSPSTAFRPFRTNAGAKVSAAPPVPTVASGATTKTTIPMRRPTTNAAPRYVQRSQQQQQQQTSTAPPPAQAPPPAVAQAAYQPAAAAFGGGGGNSRKKKRQLHKALLAGQLDHAMGSANANQVTQMEQAHPTDYIPQEETYATPANGVKVVTTSMYNPKAGGDVQADLSSQRALGKNQINQLMSAAATFQLQQARNGPNAKANSQRAGAKRKYGW